MPRMKFLFLLALLLSACGREPQHMGLREAVLEKLRDDPDLKDYKLDPAAVADCVVKAISDEAPGITGDPRRETYFQAYTRMLSVKTQAEGDKIVEEYKEFFGSAQAARQAALKVTDHIMSCMGEAIEERGE